MNTMTGTAAQVTELLRDRIGASLLLAEQPQSDTVRWKIEPRNVRAAAEVLTQNTAARYLITVGIDERSLGRGYAIVHLFSLDAAHLFLVLECAVAKENTRIDAITPVIPAANWAEREFRDAIGIDPEGHPDLRRLMLPDDWPDGTFPLRRDFPYNCRPAAVEDAKPVLLGPSSLHWRSRHAGGCS
jgi:Ni,Fe-hydrogenase III component G